jgi:uncharacterized protein (TIRG00374 family)
MQSKRSRWYKYLFFAGSLAVTVGVMGYFLSKHPPREILRMILEMYRPAVICFAVLSMAQVFFRTWRYLLLLEAVGERVGKVAMFLTTLVRNLFSDLLPARIGTLSYVWVVTGCLGIPLSSATSSFALAFLFDMIAITPMILGALVVVGASASFSTGGLIAGSVVLFALIIFILWILPGILRIAGRIAGKIKSKPIGQLGEKLAEAAEQVRQTREAGIYSRVLVLSFLVRITKYSALFFLVYALLSPYGYELGDLSAPKVFLGISSAELAASTPVSGIGGFGAYEGAWAAAFAMLGFEQSLAEATGVAGHLFTQAWGYSLGAGALVILLLPVFGKRRKKEFKDKSEQRGSLMFAVKIIVSILIVSSIVFGVLSIQSRADGAGNADKPTMEELNARTALATKLKGHIVFDSNRSGTFGIYSMNTNGGDIRTLFDSKDHEQFPNISPDGKLIAFARSEKLARNAFADIWVMDSDGKNARKLADNGSFPSFSADGKRIYFERTRNKMMVCDLDGKNVREILPAQVPDLKGFIIGKPLVSPDGEWAALASDKGGRWNAWLVNLKTGATKHIGRGCEPTWFPDGKSLVWINGGTPDTAIKRFVIESGKRSLVFDMHEPRALEYFPSITRDGKFILFSLAPASKQSNHEHANYQIYAMPLDGGDAVRITFDGHNNRWPKILK